MRVGRDFYAYGLVGTTGVLEPTCL